MPEKILVTGATGFLGSHLMPLLTERYGADCVVGVCSTDFDLLEPSAAVELLEETKPDVVVHLAAYSGGIGANRAKPADFYYRNTMLLAPMFQAAAARGVRKLLYTMGGCSYPATAHSPIGESQIWEGYPQDDSAGYSMAKKMGIVASRAYRAQYGLNSVVLIPGNMYGPYDNYRKDESHVIPAMLRRYHEAKQDEVAEVKMWGTGRALRDFVYAGDVARSLLFFIENYDSSDPVNLSSGTATSIRDLAYLIKDVTGYTGEIVWDASAPEGQLEKIFDVKRMRSLGLECETLLADGLETTYRWFERACNDESSAIRL